MNLLKPILLVCTLLIWSNAQAIICVNSSSNYKMFGSVLRADVLKRSFIMAFEDEKFTHYKIFKAENDAQLVAQIQTMTANQCEVILGLFTSQDCLVSGPIVKKNHAVALSSSCSNNHVADFYPYVYTATTKLSNYSNVVAQYINQKKDTGAIYVFFQPSDLYSNSGYQDFYKKVKKPITKIPVSSSVNFDLNMLPLNKDTATIIFFTYPLPSAQILVTLDTNKKLSKKITVIGASSWVFDFSVFRPIISILEKTKEVLTPSVVNRKTVQASHFYKKFIQLFHRPPDTLEDLNYDITRLSVQCYRKSIVNNIFSTNLFIKCIHEKKYAGITGDISFKKNSAFAKGKIELVNLMNWI